MPSDTLHICCRKLRTLNVVHRHLINLHMERDQKTRFNCMKIWCTPDDSQTDSHCILNYLFREPRWTTRGNVDLSFYSSFILVGRNCGSEVGVMSKVEKTGWSEKFRSCLNNYEIYYFSERTFHTITVFVTNGTPRRKYVWKWRMVLHILKLWPLWMWVFVPAALLSGKERPTTVG